jgi:hypothetical protein
MEGKEDSGDDVHITGSEDDKNKSFYIGAFNVNKNYSFKGKIN